MKQPKKPTRAQKRIIDAAGLNWHNWAVIEEDNISLTIIHKVSSKRRVLLK